MNNILPGRKLAIQTTKVISPKMDYEQIGLIYKSKTNPKYLSCKVGSEYYLISIPAIIHVVYNKGNQRRNCSIFKPIGKEIIEAKIKGNKRNGKK